MTDKKTEVRSTEEALSTERALKLALEALERVNTSPSLEDWHHAFDEEVTAIREALAEQPAQQQEPVAWYDEEYNCSYTAAELDGSNIDGLLPLYTSPASKPRVGLTDEQILSLVPGLQDCLCDPWDYNNSGDYYASIPKDMIRLARAIEAAHGIKENT